MSDSTVLDESVVAKAAEIEIYNSTGEKIKFGSLFEEQKTIVVFIRKHRLLSDSFAFVFYKTGHFFCGVSCLIACSSLKNHIHTNQLLFIRLVRSVELWADYSTLTEIKAYVSALAAVPKVALEHAETRIVVVGCGEADGINIYAGTYTFSTPLWPVDTKADITKFSGEIYADPSRTLYHALGMTIENLEGTPIGQQRKSYLTVGVFTNILQSIWVRKMGCFRMILYEVY